jgi:predicted transcriptional regulator
MFNRSPSPQSMNHRRDSVIIVSEILLCAVKGVGKSEMMGKVGLSSAQLKKYLQFLLRSELLAVNDHVRRPLFETTTKGKNFLETFDRITKLLD